MRSTYLLIGTAFIISNVFFLLLPGIQVSERRNANMEVLVKHVRRKNKNYDSLRKKVDSAINLFSSVRGRASLGNPRTAVVMRADYVPFVTQDLDCLENRENLLALVYVKDMKSYSQMKAILADPDLRGTALGQMAIDQIADQVTRELLRQLLQML